MYPEYGLQVYDSIQGEWVWDPDSTISNRPHHYDTLRERYSQLVRAAIGVCNPIGYRIVRQWKGTHRWDEIDRWDNGKVEV